MSFNASKLSCLAYTGVEDGNHLFFYNSGDDNAAVVTGAGYFSDAADLGAKSGDIVFVTNIPLMCALEVQEDGSVNSVAVDVDTASPVS